MAHFYSYSIEYVMELDNGTFSMLYEAAQVLTARERLFLLAASDYPHLKKEPRRTIYKDLHKHAFPIDNKNKQTTSEVANSIARMLHGR